MRNDTEQQFINKKQLSKLINVSISTINRYVAKGKIPSYKLEKKRLFKKDEILNWMENYKDVD